MDLSDKALLAAFLLAAGLGTWKWMSLGKSVARRAGVPANGCTPLA